MSTPNKTTLAKPSDRELIFTRVFDAPRELVWRVWTEPGHVTKWWGPKGFTTTSGEMDVRPGGYWEFVMHGPDGRDYKNCIHYIEVAKPERLIYRNSGEAGDEPVRFEVTVTFEAVGPQTKVTMHTAFGTREELDFVIQNFGAEEGGFQHIERLGEYLATTKAAAGSATTHSLPADDELVLTRFFTAPRELLWQAWTDPKHLTRWWGPHAFATPICETDPRQGGAYHIVMRGPDGVEYPVRELIASLSRPNDSSW